MIQTNLTVIEPVHWHITDAECIRLNSTNRNFKILKIVFLKVVFFFCLFRKSLIWIFSTWGASKNKWIYYWYLKVLAIRKLLELQVRCVVCTNISRDTCTLSMISLSVQISQNITTPAVYTTQDIFHHIPTHYTTLYHTTPHHTTPHCTTPNYTIPHHTARGGEIAQSLASLSTKRAIWVRARLCVIMHVKDP